MGETSLSTNEAFFLLLGLLIGVSSMGGVLWYFLRERNRRILELGEQVKVESQKNSEAMIEFQGLQSKHDAMLESIQGREQFTEKAMDELTNRFRNLSNRIYAEKSEEFKRNNKEQLSNLLTPLKENIDGFKKKVEDVHLKETENLVELKTQIKSLSDQSHQIGQDARNLTTALKGDTKIQGQWGEVVLERYLQNAF